jgi:aryl-alcohol dehydrogenase-like predicted oxidoreductase
MTMLKDPFGRTGHESTRLIFGAYALSEATQKEADRVLELLLEYRINHIDTARMYGNAEELVGSWMKKHRDEFFLATKVYNRRYESAWKNLKKSMELLQVEQIDLWQMHNLTSSTSWETAMGPGGALEAMLKARDKGLVRFLGVTGHGNQAAAMHKLSLERYDFDSVLLPYNFQQMQNPAYAGDFKALLSVCQERKTAVQTIKSVARRRWGKQPKTHHTYFYEPLTAPEAIEKSVHWAMGLQGSFVVAAGDIQLLEPMLKAAERFTGAPTDQEMKEIADAYKVKAIFPGR